MFGLVMRAFQAAIAITPKSYNSLHILKQWDDVNFTGTTSFPKHGHSIHRLFSTQHKEHHMKIPATLAALVLGVAAMAASTVASAQATPNINQTQANQSARIAKGEATGQLSKREANRLKAGQAKVAGMKAAAKADGKVTRSERIAIKQEQNKQSRRIARQKHDGNRK
jgi:hypothetical protein